jgi:predicted flavoprotein YhiN
MAAEVLVAGGAQVDVYDTMPSVGRKFLLAGRGGLNLTHSEPIEPFLGRYAHADAQAALAPIIRAFDGQAATAGWAGLTTAPCD